MLKAFRTNGLSEAEARSRLALVDKYGLVTRDRSDISSWAQHLVREDKTISFLEAIDRLRPDILIGATGVAGTFTEEALRLMAAINERPVVFALSNPTSRVECTADQAYRWTDGRAVFASGSPFAPVRFGDKIFSPAQGKNAYIYPGVGLGAIVCGERLIPDSMFLSAAEALAEFVTDEQIETGALYPR